MFPFRLSPAREFTRYADGTLLAAFLAVALLEGIAVNFSIGTFSLSLTPKVIAMGLVAGMALGTIGNPAGCGALRLLCQWLCVPAN